MNQPIKVKHVMIALAFIAFLIFSIWWSNRAGLEKDLGGDCWDSEIGHVEC